MCVLLDCTSTVHQVKRCCTDLATPPGVLVVACFAVNAEIICCVTDATDANEMKVG